MYDFLLVIISNKTLSRTVTEIQRLIGPKSQILPACKQQLLSRVKIVKKNHPKLNISGISRSFKVIDVGAPRKLVSSACYDKQQVLSICNRFYARRVNSGNITAFQGVPLTRSGGKSSPSHTKFCHKNTAFVPIHSEDFVILACVVLTERRTDGITDVLSRVPVTMSTRSVLW